METGQKNLLVFNIRRASAVSAAIRAVFPGSRAAPARRREIRRRSSQDYVTFCYRFSTTRGPLPHSLWKTRPAPVAPRRKRVTIITPRPRIPVQGRWPLTPKGLASRRTAASREAPRSLEPVGVDDHIDPSRSAVVGVSGFWICQRFCRLSKMRACIAGGHVLAHVVMRHYGTHLSRRGR